MCIAKKYAGNLHSLFNKIEKDFQELNNKLDTLNKAQQDILHELEFNTFNAAEGYKMAKSLKDIRNIRRDIKNEVETLTILKRDIGLAKKNINSTINEIHKLEKNQETRSYYPRVLTANVTDITEVIKKCV